MKCVLIYLVFVCSLFSCTAKSKKTTVIQQSVADTARKVTSTPYTFTFYDTGYHSPDKELMETWKAFVKAVQSDNYDSIRFFSADCIACAPCLYNTMQEDSVRTARYLVHSKDSLVYEDDESVFLPFDVFFKKDYNLIFNHRLKSRMPDSLMVTARCDETNLLYYLMPCAGRVKKERNVVMVEFFVRIVDRTKDFEGGSAILEFIKTPTGYKFSGYSTMP